MIEREYLISEYIGRFTMIVGDVNCGKTTLTQRILEAFAAGGKEGITIVDLAPRIKAEDTFLKGHLSGIGGGIEIPKTGSLLKEIRRLQGDIAPPRLRAKSEDEAIFIAKENAKIIEGIFSQAFSRKVSYLFVNDCSMYLHAGDPHKLHDWIRSAGTAVVNGYYGSSLGRGAISSRERAGMDYLISRCDRVVRLEKPEVNWKS
ncbi:MAG: hypothetical protein C4582_03820 [Desulfobacteraceae bacterium]|jgi:hypothetical protein|nr:MAG: hypothetical protein C4582_03820 [Desulfobacteraceae bacterium]